MDRSEIELVLMAIEDYEREQPEDISKADFIEEWIREYCREAGECFRDFENEYYCENAYGFAQQDLIDSYRFER